MTKAALINDVLRQSWKDRLQFGHVSIFSVALIF